MYVQNPSFSNWLKPEMDSFVSEQISIKHLRLINYDVSVQLGSSIVEFGKVATGKPFPLAA